MPNLPNTSFIPKRGPAKRNQQMASRQVYLFNTVSYVLFAATLIAAAGVFLYDRYISTQLETEVAALDAAISSFSNADMERVREFNGRLKQAQVRLENSVSVSSVFKAIEDATVSNVELTSLILKREQDNQFLLTAAVQTDSFDSSLFQRGIYERNPVIDSVVISDVQIADALANIDEESEISSGVTFTAKLGVPLSAVPYVPPALESTMVVTKEVATSTPEVLGVSTDDAASTTEAEIEATPEVEAAVEGDNQNTL